MHAVLVDFNQEQDVPLFKKYAVMNSGLIQSERYNDSVIASFGLIRVRSHFHCGTFPADRKRRRDLRHCPLAMCGDINDL